MNTELDPRKPFKVPKGSKILQSLRSRKTSTRLIIYTDAENHQIPEGSNCICITATLIEGTTKEAKVDVVKYYLHLDGSGVADLGHRGIRIFPKKRRREV